MVQMIGVERRVKNCGQRRPAVHAPLDKSSVIYDYRSRAVHCNSQMHTLSTLAKKWSSNKYCTITEWVKHERTKQMLHEYFQAFCFCSTFIVHFHLARRAPFFAFNRIKHRGRNKILSAVPTRFTTRHRCVPAVLQHRSDDSGCQQVERARI